MKKFYILFFTLIFSVSFLHAQVFFTENFSSAAGWSLSNVLGVEGANPNFFLISANEGGGITPNLGAPASCGVANNSNNTLHITSVFNPTGGASYDAGGLCGILFCPQTDRRAESPVVNCSGKTSITVDFNYIENGQLSLDNAQFWYYDGSTWSMIDDMPKTLTGCNGQGLWTSRTISLPASANNNANVKFGFSWKNNDDGVGTDPSFAVDDITFSSPSVSNTITTNALSITPNGICPCDSLQVSFTSVGSFNLGNVYTAYLSDALGNFASAVSIGSINSTANSGTISAQIPCNAAPGNQYRIRVESSNPAIVGSNNGSNILINNGITPTISVSASPNFPVCVGTSVTFSASITNGGNPNYSWKLNGNPVGTNSATYTNASLANGDMINCTLTSSLNCAINPASSNTITAAINTTPNVIANAAPGTSICVGDSIKLFGSGANTYSWTGGILNNIYFFPSTSSVYTVTGTDANGCSATSSISITVSPSTTATVSITSSPSIPLVNSAAVYTASIPASITNYQLEWYVAGILNTTATNPVNTFNYTPTSINDNVFAVLTPAGNCITPNTVTSNTINPNNPENISSVLPKEIKMYPNPIKNEFWLEGLKRNDKIVLSDINGKILFQKTNLSQEKTKIELSDFASSLYILKLEIKGKNYYLKVQKNN